MIQKMVARGKSQYFSVMLYEVLLIHNIMTICTWAFLQ